MQYGNSSGVNKGRALYYIKKIVLTKESRASMTFNANTQREY